VVRTALAAPPPKHGGLKDIKHVVMLMQENRSFDHYYGTLSGVRGFSDPHVARLPNGRNVFYQPDPSNPDGYLLPYRLNTKITAAQAIPSMSHEWTVQHEALNGGKNDNWVPAHMASDGATDGQYTMGYFTREDIPFQFALAEASPSLTATTVPSSARPARTGTCGCRARSTRTAWPAVRP
jgi:phospholipase C